LKYVKGDILFSQDVIMVCPEYFCEISAQNTPPDQIVVSVPSNANELLLPTSVQKTAFLYTSLYL